MLASISFMYSLCLDTDSFNLTLPFQQEDCLIFDGFVDSRIVHFMMSLLYYYF